MVVEINQRQSFLGGGESISGMDNSMFKDPKVGRDLWVGVEVSKGTGVPVAPEEDIWIPSSLPAHDPPVSL